MNQNIETLLLEAEKKFGKGTLKLGDAVPEGAQRTIWRESDADRRRL